MPRYKRYGPLSHDINGDAEVWEFTAKFGDRSFRTLVEVLMIIDRHENRWRLVGDWSGNLSRRVRQSVANVRRQVQDMIARGWLLVEESAADGSPVVLSAAKYAEYHRTRKTKKHDDGNTAGNKKANFRLPTILSYPNLTYSSPLGEEFTRAPDPDETPISDDLGMGEKHPANMCGWELWRKLEQSWRSQLRPLGIYQIELVGKQLAELKAAGHDPVKVVEKTIRRGWKDIRPLEEDEREPQESDVIHVSDLRARVAERAAKARSQ